jgi:hypothetical protein
MEKHNPIAQTMTAQSIQIGGVPLDTVRELRYTLIDILNADCNESTKTSALKALSRCVKSNVSNTTISGVTFKTFNNLGEGE